MHTRVIGVLVVAICLFEVQAKRDYERAFQEAVESSNVEKVERLITRKNKLPDRVFKDIVGWADDILEERMMLYPTPLESVEGIIGGAAVGIALPLSFFHVYEIGHYGKNVARNWWGGPLGFKLSMGALMTTSLILLYKAAMNPRNRCAKAYTMKFCLEYAYKKHLEEKEQS